MNSEIQEKQASCLIIDTSLKRTAKNGIVDFNSDANSFFNPFWNGKKLTIKTAGLYKVSWGFYQQSILTFYNDLETRLALMVNKEEYSEIAKINKSTPTFYAIKSSKKIIPIYLKEQDVLCLNASVLHAETPNIIEVYFTVEKV